MRLSALSSSFCPIPGDLDRYLRDIDQACAEQEAEWDPELASLEETPEGQEWEPVDRLEAIEEDAIEMRRAA